MKMKHFYWLCCLFVFGCRFPSPSNTTGLKVNLNHKHLSEIPLFVFQDTTITTLSLFGNKLTSLPDSLSKLVNLEVLYLGRNNFDHFPEVLSKFKKLRILSLAYNKIDSVPSFIKELTNLEWLYLNNNYLVHLPKEIGGLRKLEQLYLSRNRLEQLPASVYQDTSLQVLDLSFNRLTSLPNGLSKLKHLKELRVNRAGALVLLPEELCNLRYMEVLKIDANTVVPSCLLSLKTNRLQIQVVE